MKNADVDDDRDDKEDWLRQRETRAAHAALRAFRDKALEELKQAAVVSTDAKVTAAYARFAAFQVMLNAGTLGPKEGQDARKRDD